MERTWTLVNYLGIYKVYIGVYKDYVGNIAIAWLAEPIPIRSKKSVSQNCCHIKLFSNESPATLDLMEPGFHPCLILYPSGPSTQELCTWELGNISFHTGLLQACHDGVLGHLIGCHYMHSLWALSIHGGISTLCPRNWAPNIYTCPELIYTHLYVLTHNRTVNPKPYSIRRHQAGFPKCRCTTSFVSLSAFKICEGQVGFGFT